MKINEATYNALAADLKTVFAALPGADVNVLGHVWACLGVISHDRAYDDSHPAYVAGRKRILPFDGRDYCWYYAGDCNDTHVATALKRFQREFAA